MTTETTVPSRLDALDDPHSCGPANERPYRFEITDARQALKRHLISRRRQHFEAINRIDAALIALGPKLRDVKTRAALEAIIRQFEGAGT